MNSDVETIIKSACKTRSIGKDGCSDRGITVCALQAVFEWWDWDPTKSWLQQLEKILGVDSFWIHRFEMGFHRNFQIKFIVEKEGKIIRETLDPASKLGIMFAKEFVPSTAKMKPCSKCKRSIYEIDSACPYCFKRK